MSMIIQRHYESALYKSDRRRYDYSNIDLYSRMYPELEEIEGYMEKGPDKPFLLIEYCHAMGMFEELNVGGKKKSTLF